jgi:MFS family permease
MAASPGPSPAPWYRGISGYQWLLLVLASAGWIFDVYEGQVFNLTRKQLLSELLPRGSPDGAAEFWGDAFLGVFLAGGAVGGIGFGMLADRWGRKPVLVATILTYSVFSGLTYFATSLWQVGALRFLVAMGVGGEWSVAASLVAEVFPDRARAQAGAVFHASSVIGTGLAAIAGMAVGSEWRLAYVLGVLPALLVVAIRWTLSEPEAWVRAEGGGSRMLDLVVNRTWRGRALLGLVLAAVGLGTFWSVTVAGQDLAHDLLKRLGTSDAEAIERAKFAYGIVETAGGGLGLLAFGPMAARLGRRRAFLALQLAAVVVVPVTCWAPVAYWQLLALLPLYGFCTLGIHAGFAIYFPELFPARLRATGAGVCFNGGRVLAALALVFAGWLKGLPGLDLRLAVTLLAGLYLPGILVVFFLPETKGRPLPE